jgi:hypothetical protein
LGSVVLAAGYEGQCSGQHIGGEEFHAPLDDAWVWRNGGGVDVAWLFGGGRGWKHGDGKEGGLREVREGVVAKEVAPGEVGLNERDFFHGNHTLILLV